MDPASGILSGTPTPADRAASPQSLTITATDPDLESASESLVLTVKPVVDVDIAIEVDESVPGSRCERYLHDHARKPVEPSGDEY